VTIPLSLLVAHFVGDFLLQSDWMALNKSKDNLALTVHAAVYSACFLWVSPVTLFAAVVLGQHWLTDYVTSRITSRLWQANQRHWFFVVIGADQLIHYVTLAWTLSLLSA
jgi:hypothetical protein